MASPHPKPEPVTIKYTDFRYRRGKYLDRVIIRGGVVKVVVRSRDGLHLRIRRPTAEDAGVKLVGALELDVAWRDLGQRLEGEEGRKLGIARLGFQLAEAIVELVEEVADG